MDVSTIYPLLLFLFVERVSETTAEMPGILTDLESYLVRRMVCGLTTKAYNRVFLKMLTDLRQEPFITRAVIRQYLLGLSGATVEWPDDALFKARWLDTPVYDKIRASRVQMVLEALEWQHYGAKQEHAPFPASAYSVEHLLPQGANEEDWPLPIPLDADDQVRQGAHDTRRRMRDTFGNLTLVTGSLNSSLSNRPFADKLEDLRESVLRLNRYFDIHKITDWGEVRITERGERLFAEACKVWPRP